MILREFVATFGIKMDEKGLNDANARLNKFAAGAQKALVGLGVLFVANKIKNYVRDQINLADQLKDSAAALGINVEQLQRLGFAFEQSGASQEDLRMGLSRLNVLIGQAAGGSKTAQEALKGIDWKAAANGSIDSGEAFLQATDAISKLGNATLQGNKAQELFGKVGKKLIPGVVAGRVELEKLGKEYDKTGAGFSKEQVEAADKFNDRLKVLKESAGGARESLVDIFLKEGPKILDQLIIWVQQLTKVINVSQIFKAILIALGATLAIFAGIWIVANAPILAAAAAITAVVLVLEDLITMFNGGESAIGAFIDSIFGAGAGTKFINKAFTQIKDSWNNMVDALRTSGVMDMLKTIAKYTAGSFFAVITGAFLLIAGVIWGVSEAIKGVANTFELVTLKLKEFGNWLHKLGLDKYIIGVDTSSGPVGEGTNARPQGMQPSFSPAGASLLKPEFATNRLMSTGTLATASRTMPSNSDNNNTLTNNLSVVVNTASSASGDEIASRTAQEVQKVLANERRKTFESLRRTTKPLGAT